MKTKQLRKLVKREMKRQGLSGYRLSKLHGLSKSYLYDFLDEETETKVGLDWVHDLCSALGLTMTITPREDS